MLTLIVDPSSISVWSPTINSGLLIILALIGLWNTAKGNARDKTLREIKDTGEAVHILSNSQLGAQLTLAVADAKEKSVWAHRVADTSKAAGDRAAAEAADVTVVQREVLLQKHLDQQAIVDAKASPLIVTLKPTN